MFPKDVVEASFKLSVTLSITPVDWFSVELDFDMTFKVIIFFTLVHLTSLRGFLHFS